VEATVLRFEAVAETLERTALGALREGSAVNLERALRADGRLDGHIVQGHVDGTGRIRELRRGGDDVRLFVDCEPAFAELLVEKGSVAIDGVSLTVVGVEPAGFDVALIPHTLAVTTLGRLAPGASVNLEADVLGKYVKRYLERVLPAAEPGR
jgi:riboflavin synthase